MNKLFTALPVHLFIRLTLRIFGRSTSFFLAVALCAGLIQPYKSEAGIWDDKDGGNIDKVVTNVKDIKDNVQDLFDIIKDAKGTINDGKVKDMVNDMKAMLELALNSQQDGLSDFIAGGSCIANDGTPCGIFKGDLLYVLQSMEDINNQLLSMHNFPSLDLQVQDPGLGNLISQTPGRVLFPLYKVMTKTQFLNGGFIDILGELPVRLEEIRPVLLDDSPIFPIPSASPALTSLSTSSSLATTSSFTVPAASNVCLFIERRPVAITVTTTWLSSAGIVNKVLGAVLQAMSKTSIVGPKEVDAGIHGYVHGTLATDNIGAMGKITSGLGGVLSAISSSISSKVTFCGIELRQIGILRGQKEILCAMKNNNLSPECDEFIGNGFDNQGLGGSKKP